MNTMNNANNASTSGISYVNNSLPNQQMKQQVQQQLIAQVNAKNNQQVSSSDASVITLLLADHEAFGFSER
jgi:hypothetical protein